MSLMLLNLEKREGKEADEGQVINVLHDGRGRDRRMLQRR